MRVFHSPCRRRCEEANSLGPHFLIIPALLFALVMLLQRPACGATANEEQQLIQILLSNAGLTEKATACARLKRIGTVESVSVLASLLADEQLSHHARNALESMPAAEAGQALTSALDHTTGPTQVGIINSLGVRRETKAVPVLAKLLLSSAKEDRSGAAEKNQNTGTAIAAARTLGQIGGPEAITSLQGTAKNSSGAVHASIVDAMLRAADQLMASGHVTKARPIFQSLYKTETAGHIRVAAYRGLILASGNAGKGLMAAAIKGKSGPEQIAALRLVPEVSYPDASKAFAKLLPGIPPTLQIAVVGVLAQRNDPSPAPEIANLLASPDPGVRMAALGALAILGDVSVIPKLAERAATATGDEQKEARRSLALLHRGPVLESLLDHLTTAKPAVQSEAARALGARGDRAAVPKLAQLAKTEPDPVRRAALDALALLISETEVPLLVNLVVEAKDDPNRDSALEALSSALLRLQADRGHVNVESVAQALTTGSAAARIALLPVTGTLIDPHLRSALQAAVRDPDPAVHEAAVRAMCDTTDPELLGDLLQAACAAPATSLNSLAIRACVRLMTQEEAIKYPNTRKMETFKAILATPLDDNEKRIVLSGLGEMRNVEAFKLVQPMLDHGTVRAEAVRAACKIAPYLTDAKLAEATLKRILSLSIDPATRQLVDAALKETRAHADFLTRWQVAGPYRQGNKDYSVLFDTVFPPEKGDAESVKWRAVTMVGDAKSSGAVDLLKLLGGQECVAYARTWIHCETGQPALLEIGSDDGVKVWLGGKLVHANNTARGLQPGADKVKVTLETGWNPLLLKVTQHTQGWAFCVRLVKPDGSHLDGLEVQADAPKQP